MSHLDWTPKLLWSLSGSGQGSTLSAAGSSGSWSNTGTTLDAQTLADLRFVTDVTLMVTVGGVTGTPAFVVSLDVYDSLGNIYAGALATASLAAAGSKTAAGGLHGTYNGTATSYLVLPQWGRVSWAGLSSTSVTGTEIQLWGR